MESDNVINGTNFFFSFFKTIYIINVKSIKTKCLKLVYFSLTSIVVFLNLEFHFLKCLMNEILMSLNKSAFLSSCVKYLKTLCLYDNISKYSYTKYESLKIVV